MDERENLTKVAVETDGQIETMWAKPVGRDQLQIRNQPMFAWGLSFDDIVSTKTLDGRLFVDRVVERSGHSTYRLMLNEGVTWEVFEEAWSGLRELGCHYERFTTRFIGVDVPPSTDIYAAYPLFEAGTANGVWLFEEVHVGHALR